MTKNISGFKSPQDEIDNIVEEYGQQHCSSFGKFKESFSKLEDVLCDTTEHIEKVDRSLSDIEQDILEIKAILSEQIEGV